MQIVKADCRCGGRIFERPAHDSRTEWAHVDPFDRYQTQLCPDGDTAEPVSGTETIPTPMYAR